jgi:hypothetical protein
MKKNSSVEISDELNPKYIFNMTATELLIGIASGKIDAIKLAKIVLSNRGIGTSKKYVGFDNAAKDWNI